MALPKIETPIFYIKIPSLQKEFRFRPFLVKEEKLLLMAQEAGGKEEILALIQVINNCCLDSIDVDKLTTFDVEYIFLKVRARSVNNIVKLRYRDTEDNEIYEFELNLDDIQISFDEGNQNFSPSSFNYYSSFNYPISHFFADILPIVMYLRPKYKIYKRV